MLRAAVALGLDWQRGINLPGRAGALTLTGCLPFFGGAGNDYSMRGIAGMLTRLRDQPGQFGLVLANGGFLSKEAAGVYSTVAPGDWQPVSNAAIQAQCDAQVGPRLLSEAASGTVESWSVTWAKGVPQRGYAFVRTADGARILARTRKDEAAKLHALADPELIGKTLTIVHEDGVNLIAL